MTTLFEDATAQLTRLRGKDVSSVELLEAHQQRDADQRALNAVVARGYEAARRRAEAADQARARGESWGPLHGLPMTIKDTYEVVGMPTTAGAKKFQNHQPARHATAVQALVDAGAIVFGKTNLPVFAGEWQSFNPVYGTTHNPYDRSRTPGGSSGGAAAALAAGLTPLELGSDIGGSIRIPCHYCGVFGHKPTHGVVPLRGHIPGPPGTMGEPDLAVGGPMARSVRDLELVLGILTRKDEDYPPLPPAEVKEPSQLRVALWREDAHFPLETDVADGFSKVTEALESAGAEVRQEAPAGLGAVEILETYAPLLAGIIGTGLPAPTFRRLQWMGGILKRIATSRTGSPIPALMMDGFVQTHRSWLSHSERRAKMGARVAEWFKSFDVLITPVAPWSAFPHTHDGELLLRKIDTPSGPRPYADHLSYVGLASALGLPATSVPVGLSPQGLPVGVQVVAPRRQDRRCLAVAQWLEEALGGFRPPPGV